MNPREQYLPILVEKKEMTIMEVADLVDPERKGYKEWYEFAALLTSGYAEWSITKSNWDTSQAHLVAKELFLLLIGNRYKDYGFDVGYEGEPEDTIRGLFFYPSAKAYLYLNEQDEIKSQNRKNLGIAVAVACLSSFLSAVFTTWLSK